MVTKYTYEGIPLHQYCQNNGLNYSAQVKKIKRYRQKHPNLSTEKLIQMAIANLGAMTMYYYEGIPLYQYCQKNGLNYSVQVNKIKKYRQKHPNLYTEELVQMVMTSLGTRNIYYYQGITLYKYCHQHNLNYETIIRRITRNRTSNPNLSTEELIEQALFQAPMVKYFYDGKSLYQYCQEKGFDINLVSDKIKRMLANNSCLTLEQAIDDSVKYYITKRYLQNLSKVFNYLRKKETINEETLESIINFLDIDRKNLKEIHQKYKFKISTAVAIIWHFHDSESPLAISENKIREVLILIRKIENVSDKDAKDMDFADLFKLYKSGLLDTRYFMVLRERDFIYFNIYKTMNDYSLNLSRDILDDIYDETCTFFLEVIERIENNVIGKVITYINKAIKGFLIDCFNALKDNHQNLSLQSADINTNGEGKSLMERISITSTESTDFSNETIEFIGYSDELSQMFILYKYQENLNYEEIAQLLQMNIDEVKKLEHDLLLELRKNDNLKRVLIRNLKK